jgi:hypothetical protein
VHVCQAGLTQYNVLLVVTLNTKKALCFLRIQNSRFGGTGRSAFEKQKTRVLPRILHPQ